MKEINKDNYLEHVSECFSNNQKKLNGLIDSINEQKSLTGFAELRDTTPRFFNATTRAVKYFKDHKINYYTTFEKNPEQIAMESWEFYTKKLHSESINELVALNNGIVKTLNNISESREYKSRLKQRNLYSNLCIKMPYTMGLLNPITRKIPALNAISYYPLFSDYKVHINRYNDIADEVYDLDPDKDILKVFKTYLEQMFIYVKGQKYTEDDVDNNRQQNDQIKYAFTCLTAVLAKLNKKEEIEDLSLFLLELYKQESLDRLHNFQEQYEEFKQSVKVEGTEDIVIEEPKGKSLFRRKKKSNN